MCVCVYVCMYVCVCVCVSCEKVCEYSNLRDALGPIFPHPSIHTFKCTCIHIFILLCMYPNLHTYVTYIHSPMHACMYAGSSTSRPARGCNRRGGSKERSIPRGRGCGSAYGGKLGDTSPCAVVRCQCKAKYRRGPHLLLACPALSEYGQPP